MNIKFGGIELTVEGEFESGEAESFYCPESADRLHIETVKCGDADLTVLFGEDFVNSKGETLAMALELACLESLKEPR